jgi:hypothetical protein
MSYEDDEDPIDKMFREFESIFNRPNRVVIKYYDACYTVGTSWCIDAQENIHNIRVLNKKLADHIDQHVTENWASQLCEQCVALYNKVQSKEQTNAYGVRKHI